MNYVLFANRQAKSDINDILYFELVTEDGITFKNGFDSGTLFYANPDSLKHPSDERRLLEIDDLIIALATTNTVIADLIATHITRGEAESLGFFPPPY